MIESAEAVADCKFNHQPVYKDVISEIGRTVVYFWSKCVYLWPTS